MSPTLSKSAKRSVLLLTQMPDKARELRQMLAAWRRRVGAQMPTPG